jgi:hypothetical protein
MEPDPVEATAVLSPLPPVVGSPVPRSAQPTQARLDDRGLPDRVRGLGAGGEVVARLAQ